MVHGLGFSPSLFQYARDAEGRRKSLLELRTVNDPDGAVDHVWHFVSGRAFEVCVPCSSVHLPICLPCPWHSLTIWVHLAIVIWQVGQQYFRCFSNATGPGEHTWDGVPLMGLPEFGRASHWETRVLADDVMSCTQPFMQIRMRE